jgi:putative methionine-R-sulfoxide reductase with GAF domain/HAMP domain-containing protein
MQLPSFVRKSLRAKIAAFFVLFAAIITIEMVIFNVLRRKALALPKQIELALSAEYYSQEGRLSFQQFLNSTDKDPNETLGHLETSKRQLQVLVNGGRVSTIDFNFPPAEGFSKSMAENLSSMVEEIRKDVIALAANRVTTAAGATEVSLLIENSPLENPTDSTAIAVDSLSLNPVTATDSLNQKKEPQTVTAGAIDLQSRAVVIKKEFDLLLAELRKEMASRQGVIALMMLVILVVDVGLLGFFFLFMSRNISNPLKEIADAAMNQRFSTSQTEDEIGVVASNLNGIIKQLTEATTFIESIGEGKLDTKLSGNEDSSLSQALLSMQQKLKAINDDEQKRKWATEGLAKFVEILRSGEADLSSLGNDIIKALVTYTGATQGGLYVWNDDQPDNSYIQLIASYAYNRKKHEEKNIKAGEGLLGQAYLEKATTHLTEIPHNYFRIVSGLGEIDPQSILIVPLLSDNNVYGLVELASLKKFESHEIAFVEKLGESLASTLASVKTNERNKKLLQDFQEQTESLRSQEEEMRQNMEELTATQEEMGRKEQDYLRQIEDLKAKLKEASADGKWEIANQTEQTLKTNLKALNVALEELKKSN